MTRESKADNFEVVGMAEPCLTCNGRGTVTCPHCFPGYRCDQCGDARSVECPVCEGEGYTITEGA